MVTSLAAQQYKKVKDIVESKGGIIVSGTYVNSSSRFIVRCNSNHEWEADYRNLTSTCRNGTIGTWCRRCLPLTRTKQRTECSNVQYEKLLDVVAEKGGKVVSGTYVDAHSRFVIRCADCHEWEAGYYNVATGCMTWCPTCIGRGKTVENCMETAKEREVESVFR